jgi:hypothetical protein
MSRGRPADPPRGARPTQLRLGLRPSPPQRRPPTPPKWSTFRPAPPDHYSTGLDSRGFESHQPLQKTCKSAPFMYSVLSAHYAEGPGFDRRLPISVSACTQSSSGRVKRTLSARRSGFPEPGDNWGTEPSAPNDRRSDRGPGWDAAARLRPLCLIGPLRRSPTIGSSRSATSVHQLSAEPDDCFSSGAGVGSAPVETPACQEEQRCLRPFAVSVAARIRPLRQRCRPNVGVASRAL